MKKNIHHAAGPAQVLATLYFGAGLPEPVTIPENNAAGVPAGTFDHVTAEMFAHYLANVTPHFPGFTVVTAEGYWKGKPEMVRALSILAPDTDAFRGQIRGFAEQYKTMFAQEAVAYSFAACDFALDCWPFGPVKAYHKPGLGY